MKNKLVKNITLLLTFIFVLTGCSQNEDAISSLENTKTGILTFKDFDEFNKTVSKVNAMDKTERLAWEKEQGFKSFGTICDEFYDSIDFEKFTSIEDVRNLDTKNQYLDIYWSSESYNIEPKEMVTNERFIANNEKMFIISNRVYKIIESELVSANISNINSLKLINRLNEVSSNQIFELNNPQKISNVFKTKTIEEKNLEVKTANYKTEFFYQTENYWVVLPATTYRQVEFKIKNFKMGMFGWYAYELSIDYDIYLESYDDISQLYLYIDTDATGDKFKSKSRSEKILTNSYKCTNELYPYFLTKKVTISTSAGLIKF